MPSQTRPLRIVLVTGGGCFDRIHTLLNRIKGFHFLLCHAQTVHALIPLSSVREFDLIILDLSGSDHSNRTPLEQAREAFSSVPVVVLVSHRGETARQEMLRVGARDVLSTSTLTVEKLAEAILLATGKQSRSAIDECQLLEQSLDFLQQDSLPPAQVLSSTTFGLKPLSEALPHKFLELTKSYSNLIEQVRHRDLAVRGRIAGYSVSQKLQALASDLGSLKAGARDVIDIHTRATERTQDGAGESAGECRKILLELMSDLAQFYRHARV